MAKPLTSCGDRKTCRAFISDVAGAKPLKDAALPRKPVMRYGRHMMPFTELLQAS